MLRRHRAKQPVKMFEADELRGALIDGAALVVGENGPDLVQPDATLRAMILLGVNVGFGNSDCAGLMFAGMNLAGAWIDYPRPKTGIARRCPLWPETVAAIEAAVKVRPKPADYPDCGRVFLSARGNAYIHSTGGFHKDLVTIQFTRHLRTLASTVKGLASIRCVTRSALWPTRCATRSRSTSSWATPTRAWVATTASESRMRDCGLSSIMCGSCSGR